MRITKILIVTSIILLSNYSYSQHKLGIRGGVGISDLTGADFSKVSTPKLGVEFAGFYEININPTLGFSAELCYHNKGSNYEFYPRDETTVFVDIRSSYFSLPISLKAYFGRKASFYIYAGLAYSKLFDHSIEYNAKREGLEIDATPFFTYKISNSDASVNAGCGFAFKRLFLDFRYQHGLKSIYEGSTAPAILNRFLSVTLGCTLYEKKVIHCLGGGR